MIFGILVIIGLYIIFKVEGDYTLGILYALFAAFTSSIFSLINGKVAPQYDSSMISFYELLSGVMALSLYIVVMMLFTQEKNEIVVSFFQMSTSDWIFLFLLASVCTAYAFLGSVHVM